MEDKILQYIFAISFLTIIVVGIYKGRIYPFFGWVLHTLIEWGILEIIIVVGSLVVITGLIYMGVQKLRGKKQPIVDEQLILSERREKYRQLQQLINSMEGLIEYDLITNPFDSKDLDKTLKDNDIVAKMTVEKGGAHFRFVSEEKVPCFRLLEKGILDDFVATPLEEEEQPVRFSESRELEEGEKPMREKRSRVEEGIAIIKAKTLIEANVKPKEIVRITGLPKKTVEDLISSADNNITIKIIQGTKEPESYEKVTKETCEIIRKILQK